MDRRLFSLPTSPYKNRSFLRRATRRALLLSLAMVSLSRYASAANTEYDVNKNSGSNLDLTTTYTVGGTAGTGAGGTTAPANLPSVTSDVTFDSGTYTTTAFTVPTSITFGSLNDLSTTALTISNTGGSAASVLTLGGSGDLGDGVPGSNAADLLFVGTGGSLTLTGGSGVTALGLALGSERQLRYRRERDDQLDHLRDGFWHHEDRHGHADAQRGKHVLGRADRYGGYGGRPICRRSWYRCL